MLSCLTKKAYGTQPGHAQFYYPKKYGYGELWLRMAEQIKDKIIYNCTVNYIDFNKNEVSTKTNERFQVDIIISTIPWLEFGEIVGMPEEIRGTVDLLS